MFEASSIPCESSVISALRTGNDSLKAEVGFLKEEVEQLRNQVAWFNRHVFGEKSEKRLVPESPNQLDLFAGECEASGDSAPETQKISYERRKRKKCREGSVTESGLRFDETVPMETIEVPLCPEAQAIPEERRVLIGMDVTHRLAQRPGSYVILRYERPIIRDREAEDSGKLYTAPVPVHVLERSIADVSFLSGMLVDKFMYHLPLYRQHQRLAQGGITVARATLTNLVGRAIDLLIPVYDAQHANILKSRVLAMDETPIKAGRKSKGKMRRAYFWPVYGELDEVVFPYAESRASCHVKEILGTQFEGVLLTDGYDVYARYAQQCSKVVHAGCWVHCRRYFETAVKSEPDAGQALDLIGELYRHEKHIGKRGLSGAQKLKYRTEHSLLVVESFWQWCRERSNRGDLLPSNPLTKALKYALSRVEPLRVFLSDPDVAPDTNHLERAIRPIPMGRKNWLFCWTEVGARRVAVIQSLLVTCRLQGVDPYVYLVDVLQRVGQHPARDVEQLTPRQWKTRFADNPLTSDLGTIKNT